MNVREVSQRLGRGLGIQSEAREADFQAALWVSKAFSSDLAAAALPTLALSQAGGIELLCVLLQHSELAGSSMWMYLRCLPQHSALLCPLLAGPPGVVLGFRAEVGSRAGLL